MHEHPIRTYRGHTGELGAFKIYDFVTRRKLRKTCLPAPRGSTRTFNLERDSSDFEERERTMLDVLQPHLLQVRRSTEVRRRARLVVTAAPDGALSERETEVLTRVAEGMRNREIAEALWIAPGTVRKHLDNIRAKLGARTRTEAVRLAQERGSVEE